MKNLFFTAITFFGLASITMAQVPTYVPSSGLIVYYPFSGNANDQSGSGYNGTVSGANLTTDRFGNINSAYNFVGSLGSIITSSPSLPTGNASRAISVWVKTSSLTGGSGVNMNILVNWGFPGINNMSEISIDLGIAYFRTYASTAVSSATNISDNTWHNVVSTYDNTLSSLKIYIDGVLKGTTTGTFNTTPSQLSIGERNAEIALQKMDGVLDDIGIWNRALTACEITQLYNASVFTTPTITAFGATTLCSGNTTTLTTSTIGSYTWSNGANTQSITVSTPGAYSVSVTNGSCIGNASPVVVSVNPTPTITVSNGTICSGKSFTMIPAGASTYTYTSGSAVVSPTASSTYSVIGTSSLGCVSSNTAISSVTVNANPTVLASTSNSLICVGNSAVLTASTAATSYTWNTGATTMSVSVSPTITTTYSVTASNLNGCVGNGSVTVNVSICTGINELNSNSISVYPNPNNGVFTIELNATTQVIITSVLGNVLFNSTLDAGKQTLDIKNNANGIYFVQLTQDGKQQTIKLIKE